MIDIALNENNSTQQQQQQQQQQQTDDVNDMSFQAVGHKRRREEEEEESDLSKSPKVEEEEYITQHEVKKVRLHSEEITEIQIQSAPLSSQLIQPTVEKSIKFDLNNTSKPSLY
jgi:hypothetical protein